MSLEMEGGRMDVKEAVRRATEHTSKHCMTRKALGT